MQSFFLDEIPVTQVEAIRNELKKFFLFPVVSEFEESIDYQLLLNVRLIAPNLINIDSNTSFSVLDAFVEALGLSFFESRGREEISEEEARNVLIHLFTRNIVYDGTTGVNYEQAESFVEELLSIFPSKTRFFTNAVFVQHPFRLLSYLSLTAKTIDYGVILLDNQHIGIVWAAGDD